MAYDIEDKNCKIHIDITTGVSSDDTDTTKYATKDDLANYAKVGHTHSYNDLTDLPYISSGGNNITATVTSMGEYTLNFEDEIASARATKRYENSAYTDYKKNCMYIKYALMQATKKIHNHGGGTLLFTKLYTVDGGIAAWEIDDVDNVTFRGVGEAGFIKPDPNMEGAGTSTGKQHFGYIRHCNNLRFINMSFTGRQTDMTQLYLADYGVEIHSGDGIFFEECTFKNMNDACLVVGNETVKETDGLDCTKNVHVNRCKFINCWQTSTTQNGVYNYWFTNNYVAGGSTKFAQRKPNGDHIYILNNVYIAHEHFIGNVIEMCNYNNVVIDGNIIKGNANTACAFSNYYNTHADDNYYQTHKSITFTNNKIYGCKAGIYMNHGVARYPAGRFLIQGNTFEDVKSTKNISISGYYDNIEIKDNQFINSSAMGIAIGSSASPIIKKLDVVGNTFMGIFKATFAVLQQINVLRMVDNYMVQGGANHMIKFGDGTNNGTVAYFEMRGNYLVNNTGQSIMYSQGSEITLFMVKDNSIIGNGYGLTSIKSPKMILSNNYIETAKAPIVFMKGSIGTIYTNANVLSKPISLGDMTELKL